MRRRRALITGITGQDGSYLAELLLTKGYEVHGLIRRSSVFNTDRLVHIFQDPHAEEVNLYLHYGDMSDATSLIRLVKDVQPDEIYNLAAQSHVRVSFDIPHYTCDVVAIGTLNLLEAIRMVSPSARFFQATSSEIFGKAREVPQSETTPVYPRSPYGVAKAFAYWMTINYREAHKLFACNGVMFNHESPRRGETFVTRKITRGIARVVAGQQSRLYLGNLDAARDWGYAGDYVEGMWRVVQAPVASDYVLATGESHTVREFLHECCKHVGLDPEAIVDDDPRYYRPTEVDLLIGDASKAKRELGWSATIRFADLVRLMLAADLEGVGVDPTQFGLPCPTEKAVIQGRSA